VIESALKKAFAPEFLNRIDDVIVFEPLEREDISKIVHIELRSLLRRMESLEYHVQLEDSAVTFLADKGFDPKFGARPLQRAIQRYVEDPLAEEIVKGTFHPGDTVVFSGAEGAELLSLAITPATPPQAASQEPSPTVPSAESQEQPAEGSEPLA
jgi:ATP-dependent Clp protease ATP-binding subunit ClpC